MENPNMKHQPKIPFTDINTRIHRNKLAMKSANEESSGQDSDSGNDEAMQDHLLAKADESKGHVKRANTIGITPKGNLDVHRPRRGTLIISDDEDGVSMHSASFTNMDDINGIDYSKVNTNNNLNSNKKRLDTKKIFEPYVQRSVSDPKRSFKAGSNTDIEPKLGNSKPMIIRQVTASNLAALADGKNRLVEKKMLKRPTIPDYTSVNTGAFSECMFNTELEKQYNNNLSKTTKTEKPTPNRLGDQQEEVGNGGQATLFTADKFIKSPVKSLDNEERPELSNGQNQSKNQNQTQFHKEHKKHRHQKSFSQSYVSNDQKRLVNQFLQSIEKSGNNSALSSNNASAYGSTLSVGKNGVFNIPQHEQMPDLMDYSSNLSLQSLLYHDLADPSGSKRKYSKVYSNPNMRPGSATPFSYSSASLTSNSDDSRSAIGSYRSGLATSSFFFSNAKLTSKEKIKNSEIINSNANDSNMFLGTNETDYYQQHINSRLTKLESQIKNDLKSVILKDELELKNNITSFDNLTSDLQNLKSQILGLKNTIANEYLTVLKADFDENNPESFESQLRKTVEENVKHLEFLENKMSECQSQLVDQKETMRKMESLLYLENSLMVSKKNTGLAYKYRYMLYDILTLGFLVLIGYYLKAYFWKV